MKLKNLKNTVSELETQVYKSGHIHLHVIFNINNKLEEELELWMFLPCKNDGSLIDKPIYNPDEDEIIFERKYDAYKKAKKRVLFKNVIQLEVDLLPNEKMYDVDRIHVLTIIEGIPDFNYITFEELVDSETEFELTEAGDKYFYLIS